MARCKVSIVIPSYNSRNTLPLALEALQAQKTSVPFEIILVDSSTDGSGDLVAARFPDVKLIRSEQRLYPGAGRNRGIREATGEILAFTDADCIADPGWVEAIAQAQLRDLGVIGGIVDNANPENATGWAYYFTEFNYWAPGAPEGFVNEIPTCCLSMKRSAFERWGPFKESGYCSDSVFHWAMAADGKRPYLDPRIRVAHINPSDFPHLLGHEYEHGKFFADARARYQGLSRWRLLLHAVTAPLLPFILFGRAFRRIRARGCQLPFFFRSSLQTFAGMTCWSMGEFSGYLGSMVSRDLHKG
ncbi:MAG: glycosyltransferase [Xanthomonadales bacterium]|nr:glycosyltransferase [Xanthomonadales bacterium]